MLEWRVWETGAPRFNTRIRFPGQYHDAETDFYENWNRFYDPTTGRYLSGEPLLRSPSYVQWMQQTTAAVASYSYAASNPLRYTDPDGLRIRIVGPPSRIAATRGHVEAAKRDPVIGWMVRELDEDPNFTHEINNFDDPEADSSGPYTGKTADGCETMLGRNLPGVTPDGFNSSPRDNTWHELGHGVWRYMMRNLAKGLLSKDAWDKMDRRYGVMFENRSRMPGPLRYVHWDSRDGYIVPTAVFR